MSPLHFTGKQRDTETNNDDFGARYFNSGMARWLKGFWSRLASVFYVKASVGVGLHAGAEMHVGKSRAPIRAGVELGASVKSTGKLTTSGLTMSGASEAGMKGKIGKYDVGPVYSVEHVTVKDGKALEQHEVTEEKGWTITKEKVEGTASKSEVGVGSEVSFIVTVGCEVGINLDKLRSLIQAPGTGSTTGTGQNDPATPGATTVIQTDSNGEPTHKIAVPPN